MLPLKISMAFQQYILYWWTFLHTNMLSSGLFSQYSSFTVVWTITKLWFDSRQRPKIFILLQVSCPDLGLTELPIRWIQMDRGGVALSWPYAFNHRRGTDVWNCICFRGVNINWAHKLYLYISQIYQKHNLLAKTCQTLYALCLRFEWTYLLQTSENDVHE
jgi:hypothetical protein